MPDGAFTLAALVYVFHMHDLHAAIRPTVLFGLLGYGSVLVILFFDLGRWDRFWHFLVYPNLTSALFEVELVHCHLHAPFWHSNSAQ